MNNAVTIRNKSPSTSHSRNSSPMRPADASPKPAKKAGKATRNKGDKKSSTSNEVADSKKKANRKQATDQKAELSYGSVKVMQRSDNLPSPKELSQQQQQQTNNRDHKKSNVPSVKSRRNQRRKEITAVTDALEKVEADLNSTSELSTGESDSSIADTPSSKHRQRKKSPSPKAEVQSTHPPVKKYASHIPNDFLMGKSSFTHPLLFLPPNSKPVKNAARPPRPRRRSGSILEIPQKQSVKTVTLSKTPPSDFMFGQSAINPLYAGPTFSNSPAPSALPMPVAGISNLRPMQNPAREENVFSMEDYDTNQQNAQVLRQKSLDLLDMLGAERPRSEPPIHSHPYHSDFTSHQHNVMPRYHVPYHQQQLPFKMTTSHKLSHDVTPSLSEIQQNLRSMLKIQSGM
ncbi:hypothetical protein NQZ79_g3917 [Umbelopsis isabellina]|nr:hypothetical protein NQZ79_g3917 [Umbelopsis isabellina]